MLYRKNKVPYYKFEIFEPFRDALVHAVSGREGGVSPAPFDSLNLNLKLDGEEENVRKNYELFCGELGISMDDLVVAYQEHTDQVLVVRSREEFGIDNAIKGVDGFITDVPGVCLVSRFADCQGVFLFDPVKKVIAAVHSGWRGNTQNIIGKTVLRMKEEFGCDPSDILAAVGQSLGPCCAEFTNPVEELPKEMHKYILDDGKHVDLWQCAFGQLTGADVDKKNIEIARECTKCKSDRYFSFRKAQGPSGHMAGVISLI